MRMCVTCKLDTIDGGMYIAVTSSKFLNQCFTDASDDIKSYVDSKRIIRR